MGHGGKRIGAGRRKGVPGKRTAERIRVAELALKTGVSPIDIMYKNMLIWDRQADSAEEALAELSLEAVKGMKPDQQFDYLLQQAKKAIGFRELSQRAACDLAPYRAPKLSSITVEGSQDKPIVNRVERVIVRSARSAG